MWEVKSNPLVTNYAALALVPKSSTRLGLDVMQLLDFITNHGCRRPDSWVRSTALGILLR